MNKQPKHKRLSNLVTEIKKFAREKDVGQKRLTMFRHNGLDSAMLETEELKYIFKLLKRYNIKHQRCGGCDLLTKL